MSKAKYRFNLDAYQNKYENIIFTRRDGVLEMRLHTNNDSLVWHSTIHTDLVDAFHNVGHDPENRVVILTGTGKDFCIKVDADSFRLKNKLPPMSLESLYREGRAMLLNHLQIPCTMIAAVNGRAHTHSELALFCDLIICGESASFRDRHLEFGMNCTDGVHVAYPMAFGMNRGRNLLITGDVVTAQKALEWGSVYQVVPNDQLLDAAWKLALELAKRAPMAMRTSREVYTREISRQLQETLGYGLAVEGLASGYGAWYAES